MNCLEKYPSTWSKCKELIAPLRDNVIYIESPDKYEIFVLKEHICFYCTIYKYRSREEIPENFAGLDFDANYDALIDFETNYKNRCRLDLYTYIKNAAYSPVREFQLVGKKFTVYPPLPPNEVRQNIFDIRIDENLCGADGFVEFIGGAYYIREADKITDDDFVEVSIVDKDDILGLFSIYGLQQGTDVLELAKFIKTHCVIGGQRIIIDGGQPKLIPAGLYIRISYFSYGTSPFIFKTDLFLPR